MTRWRSRRRLETGEILAVSLLVLAVGAGAYWLGQTFGPRRGIGLALLYGAVVSALAAWGWPDWLSQVLRLSRIGVAFDEDEAQAWLMVQTVLLFAAGLWFSLRT